MSMASICLIPLFMYVFHMCELWVCTDRGRALPTCLIRPSLKPLFLSETLNRQQLEITFWNTKNILELSFRYFSDGNKVFLVKHRTIDQQ